MRQQGADSEAWSYWDFYVGCDCSKHWLKPPAVPQCPPQTTFHNHLYPNSEAKQTFLLKLGNEMEQRARQAVLRQAFPLQEVMSVSPVKAQGHFPPVGLHCQGMLQGPCSGVNCHTWDGTLLPRGRLWCERERHLPSWRRGPSSLEADLGATDHERGRDTQEAGWVHTAAFVL